MKDQENLKDIRQLMWNAVEYLGSASRMVATYGIPKDDLRGILDKMANELADLAAKLDCIEEAQDI